MRKEESIMELISVRELFKNTDKYAGQEIEIGGWVRNRRPSKQFGFIVLNDGTYFTPVQVVYNDTIENFQEISKINVGAALIVKGTVVLTPGSSSLSRFRQKLSPWKVLPPAISPCSPSATPWSFCAPSPICVPEPTPSRQCSVSAAWLLWRSTSSSRIVISCMSIPP